MPCLWQEDIYKGDKTMAHRGNDSVRTKIVVSKDILEQISYFNYNYFLNTYLGCDVSYD